MKLKHWLCATGGMVMLIGVSYVGAKATTDPITDPKDAWVKLFDDKNFQDNVLTIKYPTDIPNMKEVTWDGSDKKGKPNDRASSVRYKIPRGWSIVLSDDTDYKDNTVTLTGTGEVEENGDLGTFSDKCSSARWLEVK